jgi:DNA repair exonuclease SbcCD nuclease subunit
VGDILLAHLAVNGAMTNTFYGVKSDVIVEYDNEMVLVDPGLFDDWEMTLMGHYHGAQKLNGKVEYVGSPLQLSFGEAFQQKHVIVLDLETMEKQYIINDFSPQHLIITPQDVEHENYNLTGNFVRIAVKDMGQADLLDLQRKIQKGI